jgi:hypothetical protein
MWSDCIAKGSESKRKKRRIDNWKGWRDEKKGDERE